MFSPTQPESSPTQVARLNLNLLLSHYLRKTVKHRREEDAVLSRDDQDEERRAEGRQAQQQQGVHTAAHAFVRVREGKWGAS